MFQPRQQHMAAFLRSSKSRTNITWGSMNVAKQEAAVYCFTGLFLAPYIPIGFYKYKDKALYR